MVLLQWGRDQTIAEMPAGNCTRSAVLSLQWGRDQTIAEMHPPATGTVEQAPASMGPRSDDRGNGGDGTGRTSDDLLQWGRDQTIAEMKC